MTSKTNDLHNRALVIGGGGVTGIAWVTGMLLGLERAGIKLRNAERLVGTSAGSVVAAQLTGDLSLEELYENQLQGKVEEIPGSLGILAMIRIALPLIANKNTQKALQKIGSSASKVGRSQASARREVIAQRLTEADWNYERDLRITAIDIDLGRRRVFQAGGPATLLQAVEASCAVPGVWPVVEIDDHRYMDGGVLSPANTDLAEGANSVIVLAPMARGVKKEASPVQELETLLKQADKNPSSNNPATQKTLGRVISPDQKSRKAFGKNPLDPAARSRAAAAGLEQSKHETEEIAKIWNR